MKFFIVIKEKSQRIKKKNFVKLGNKELWKHLILELKGQEVFLDTDSNKIISECKKKFPWVTAYPRKKEFIDFEEKKTTSPALLMINNFLDNYVKNKNEIIICTHVTSPFLKLKTIKKAVKKMNNHDSVTSVTKHQEFSWMLKGKKEKKLFPINFNPKIVSRTQNLDPIYMSNGSFFIFKKKTFKKYNNRIGKNVFYYELKFPESVEIDNKEDLNLARKIL
jgi:N-acylneuraminate cytidylyltransferase